MSPPLPCPACGAHDASVVENHPTHELVQGYAAPPLGLQVQRHFPAGLDAVRLLQCPACDLRWYAPMVCGDARFYEELQALPWYYQQDKPEFGHAGQHIADGWRVLEVGCGGGAFGATIQARTAYTGLEFNDQAAAKARARGLQVLREPVQAMAARQGGSFDAVCHFQVLEHVPDVASFMQACVDCLKVGGWLMVSVPAEDSFLRLAGDNWLNAPPHHVTRWSDAALQALFGRLGLGEVSLWHEPVAEYHRDWYEKLMVLHRVDRKPRRWLPGQRASWADRLALKLASHPGARQRLVAAGEAAFEFAGRGHTVTVRGRKLPA